MMYPYLMDYAYGFGGLGVIFSLLWFALVIVAIVALVRWISRISLGVRGGRSALDILKERYARGEIGKKEFEEKKKDISEQS